MSNFKFLSEVMRPFVIGMNAVPRIALVPIIVIVFGPNQVSCVIISVLVVFFVAFFSAYEGGTSVRQELVQNARLLGASDWRILTAIRLQFVMAWTLAGWNDARRAGRQEADDRLAERPVAIPAEESVVR